MSETLKIRRQKAKSAASRQGRGSKTAGRVRAADVKPKRAARRPERRLAKVATKRPERQPGERGLSVLVIATELGIARETVRRRLLAGGVDSATTALRWRDVVRVFSGGDWKMERTRLLRAQADQAEHDLRVARRDVIPRDDVAKFLRESFGPVRELAMAMPAVMAPRTNPSDPVHARTLLEEWSEMFLAHVRERNVEHTDDGQEEDANAKS